MHSMRLMLEALADSRCSWLAEQMASMNEY